MPEQMPWPALKLGVVQPAGGLVQLAGLTTFIVVLPQPFSDVAVMLMFCPTVKPLMVLPLMVPPPVAVTFPLLVKVTL